MMSDLKICRVCLNHEVKGYSMDQYNLKQCYEQVIRAKVNDREGLPRWFCYECSTLLQKFDKFKERCLKGQLTLRQMVGGRGISYDSVKIINRYSEKLVSQISIIMTSKHVKTICLKHKKIAKAKEKQNTEQDPKTLPESTFVCIPTSFDDYKDTIKDPETTVVKEENKPDSVYLENDTHIQDDQYDDNDMSNEDISVLEDNQPQEQNMSEEIDLKKFLDNEMTSDDEYLYPLKKDSNTVNTEPNVELKGSKKPAEKKSKQATASENKPKKFEVKKKDLNPEHWKKIILSEEEVMAEFKLRATSEKYLKANYQCKDCFKGFSKLDMLLRHVKQAHDEAIGEFKCRFCRTHYRRKNRLARHMTEHYVRYQCRRCDMRCREYSALFHDDVHNGVIRKCEHCGREFKHSSTYYTHLRMTHRSAHVCPLCGASFVSAAGLAKHARLMHSDTDEIVTQVPTGNTYCEKCDIKFVTQRAYNLHLVNSNMHGDNRNLKAKYFRDKTIPTTCPHCNKHFPSRSAYKKHHLTEHPDIVLDDREICEICGVSLSAGSVAQHLVRHTGERPFPCSACDKRFTQQSSMKLHYKTVHLKQPYPKYPSRKKNYRRRKKTEEAPQNDFSAFTRPSYYI